MILQNDVPVICCKEYIKLNEADVYASMRCRRALKLERSLFTNYSRMSTKKKRKKCEKQTRNHTCRDTRAKNFGEQENVSLILCTHNFSLSRLMRTSLTCGLFYTVTLLGVTLLFGPVQPPA